METATLDGGEVQHWQLNAPDVVGEAVDDEVVVVNLRTGAYYSLTGSAARIWPSLADGFSTPEILKKLEPLFIDAVDEQAINQFLAQVIAEQLFVAVATPAQTIEQDTASTFAPVMFSVPELEVFSDMQELLELDPIHEVIDSGWPNRAD